MLRIMGRSKATVEQLQTYIKKVNPKATDSVTKLAAIYITEGETEGVRGDVAFAQSCLESGNFTFSGSANLSSRTVPLSNTPITGFLQPQVT